MKEGETMLDFEKELAVRIMKYGVYAYPFEFTNEELFDMCIDTYNDLQCDNVEPIIEWFEKEKEEREENYAIEEIQYIITELESVPKRHAEQLKENLKKTFSKSVDK